MITAVNRSRGVSFILYLTALSFFVVIACVQAQTSAPPKLTLAKAYRSDVALNDYWVSEKLDGVRAYWNGTHLLTRSGNVIAAPPWFTKGFPHQALDGELWGGRGKFQFVASTVLDSNPDAEQWRKIRFMLFDLHASNTTFDDRLPQMRSIVEASDSPYLSLVDQFKVQEHKALQRKLDEVTQAGAEGLMLHRGSAPYVAGRSDDVLKLKRWQDAEAMVIAYVPGKGKFTGLMGSMLVEDNGKRFRVGSGFTLAERRSPPPAGAIITYKYWGLTDSGLPRFPSFLRLRPPGS